MSPRNLFSKTPGHFGRITEISRQDIRDMLHGRYEPSLFDKLRYAIHAGIISPVPQRFVATIIGYRLFY